MKLKTLILPFLLLFVCNAAFSQKEKPAQKDETPVLEDHRVEEAPPPPPKKKRLMPVTPHAVRWREESLFGFIQNGKVIIPIEYQFLDRKYSDFMIAKKDDLYGVLNKTGDTIITFEYDRLYHVCDNNLLLALKGEKWGAINKKGEPVIPLDFEIGSSYGRDMLYFSKPGLNRLYDCKLNLLLETNYDRYDISGTISLDPSRYLVAYKDEKAGLITYTNELLFPFDFDRIKWVQNGMIGVANYYPDEEKWKAAVYNFDGQELVPFKYRQIAPPNSLGYLEVLDDTEKLGLIRTNGSKVLPNDFVEIGTQIRDGYFLRKEKSMGIMDTLGKEIIPFDFGMLNMISVPITRWKVFSYGLTPAKLGSTNTTYIETTDSLIKKRGLWHYDRGEILKPEFDAVIIKNDLGPIAGFKGDKAAIFDTTGQKLTDYIYLAMRQDPGNPSIVLGAARKHTDLFTFDGKKLNTEPYDKFVYRDFKVLPTGHFFTKRNGKLALHDHSGAQMTEHKYSSWRNITKKDVNRVKSRLGADRIVVVSVILKDEEGNSKAFFLDNTGQEITPE